MSSSKDYTFSLSSSFWLHFTTCAKIAFAAFSPSTAALTIPPAYPAPSPTGCRPFNVIDSNVTSSLSMRTGALVLVWMRGEDKQGTMVPVLNKQLETTGF